MKPILGRWPTLTAWLVGIAVLGGVPWMGVNAADVRLLTLVAILALSVSSLNLTLGFAGELALAQVAIYAAGAYTTGYVAINVTHDLLACLGLSVAVAVVIGLVAGLPGTRLGGWTLAITSFFVVLLVPSAIKIFGDSLGGLAGLNGIPLPTVAGRELATPDLYVAVVVVTAAWFAVFRNIVVSRRGAALLVLKESPVLAAAIGISPRSTKLTAYALGAVPAGVAGCFFAFLDSYLSPMTFGLDLAIMILAASVLGGPRSVYGAIVGAAIMQVGPMRVTEFDQYAPIGYGAFLILGAGSCSATAWPDWCDGRSPRSATGSRVVAGRPRRNSQRVRWRFRASRAGCSRSATWPSASAATSLWTTSPSRRSPVRSPRWSDPTDRARPP